MKRRSILGTGTVAPIRIGDHGLCPGNTLSKAPSFRASRHSAVSRQLTFNIGSTMNVPSTQVYNELPQVNSNEKVADYVKQNFAENAVSTSLDQNIPSSVGPSEIANNCDKFGENVKPGISACEASASKSVNPGKQVKGSRPGSVSKQRSASKSACSKQQGNRSLSISVSKQGSASKSAYLKKSSHLSKPALKTKFVSAAQSGSIKKTGSATSAVSDSRIPRFLTSQESGLSSLNTTAAFEEAELAALVSTPPTSMRNDAKKSSLNDSNYLAEQIGLLITDQRSLMAGLQLNVFKMDSVMSSLNEVSVNLKQLFQTRGVDVGAGSKPVNTSFVGADSTFNSSENTATFAKPPILLNQCVLSPTPEGDEDENKENAVKPQRKSLSVYHEMKSRSHFLKTPSNCKTDKPSTDTPNTVLSNTICNQLENLFELSDIKDV